ncbi:hypothetical protein [Oryza sativa Japonica Group]|uniref:Uncharacterized protein B1129G05.19 n=1 Tax=Oryza sativa subsp. japonica TaxID=39947 RepID=Q657B1_ORYSJ|nr:hypothetical protein [Oryza sativa Japonica Group]
MIFFKKCGQGANYEPEYKQSLHQDKDMLLPILQSQFLNLETLKTHQHGEEEKLRIQQQGPLKTGSSDPQGKQEHNKIGRTNG